MRSITTLTVTLALAATAALAGCNNKKPEDKPAAAPAPHVEPATIDVAMLPHAHALPYRWLHQLRRAFAHPRADAPAFAPAPLDFAPDVDPLLAREADHADSHLCCHADAEGYYLPRPLPALLADDAGGLIGSAVALLDELRAVAPLLDIPVTDAGVTSAVAYSLLEADALDPLRGERIAWGALWATATASVASGALLVFR